MENICDENEMINIMLIGDSLRKKGYSEEEITKVLIDKLRLDYKMNNRDFENLLSELRNVSALANNSDFIDLIGKM